MRETAIKSGKIERDMRFNEKVWALTARVPRGKVATYGEIARALGTQAYRAVGNALNHNPYAPLVPCHRIVGSDGALTGFAAGVSKKREMLAREGVKFRGQKVDLSHRVTLGGSRRSTARTPGP